MTARILVAGIGNIFLGDDGFGSEVVRNAETAPDDPTIQRHRLRNPGHAPGV